MGKIKEKINKAFDKLTGEGDFEGFIKSIVSTTDYSVRYKWQYGYVTSAIRKRIEDMDTHEVLSNKILAKKRAKELKGKDE